MVDGFVNVFYFLSFYFLAPAHLLHSVVVEEGGGKGIDSYQFKYFHVNNVIYQ